MEHQQDEEQGRGGGIFSVFSFSSSSSLSLSPPTSSIFASSSSSPEKEGGDNNDDDEGRDHDSEENESKIRARPGGGGGHPPHGGARKESDEEEEVDRTSVADSTPRDGGPAPISDQQNNDNMMDRLSAFVRLPEEFSSLSSNDPDHQEIALTTRNMKALRETSSKGTTIAVDDDNHSSSAGLRRNTGMEEEHDQDILAGLRFAIAIGGRGEEQEEVHHGETNNNFFSTAVRPLHHQSHSKLAMRGVLGLNDENDDELTFPSTTPLLSTRHQLVRVNSDARLLQKAMDDDRMEVTAPPATPATRNVRDEGHTLTPSSKKKGEKKSTQTRADEATATGLPTGGEKRKSTWQNCYLELLDYKKEHGNCNVPFAYAKLPGLAQWVKRQRYQYKCKLNGKHSHLTDARQQLLEDAGFVWDTHGAAWDENYSKMVEFWGEHGHCNVPMREKELSAWAKRQRRHYKQFNDSEKKHLSTTMTEDRIVRLNEISFAWHSLRTTTSSPSSSSYCPHDHGQPSPRIPQSTSIDSAVGLIASVTTAISTSSTPLVVGTTSGGGRHGRAAAATSSLPARSLSTSVLGVVDEEATRGIEGTEEDESSSSSHQHDD
jgi:hypothetical protein